MPKKKVKKVKKVKKNKVNIEEKITDNSDNSDKSDNSDISESSESETIIDNIDNIDNENVFIYNFMNKYKINKNQKKIYESLYESINNIFLKDNYKELLENELITTDSELYDNDEVLTPYELSNKILQNIDDTYFMKYPKILDYCCGKGSIIFNTFIHYYNILVKVNGNDKLMLVRHIIESCLYIGDINPLNVFITICIIKAQAFLFTNIHYNYKFNIYVGDALKLNLFDQWEINKIDGIFVNPPFHDANKQKKTFHKLWIDLTIKTFDEWLDKNGLLFQISPDSFSSPSSKILKIMKEKNTLHIYFNEKNYFPNVGTTIAWYLIENKNKGDYCIKINGSYDLDMDNLIYIPQKPCQESLGIHSKVMFSDLEKIDLKYDYVTAHNNIILKSRRNNVHSSLSKVKTNDHIYPVFHTNSQIWYSEKKQDFSDKKKVIWTRSGYTKPFYDNGNYGVTDLSYYVLVDNDEEGNNLEKNLNTKLFEYILKTAKWSGFGNDKVFKLIPNLKNNLLSDEEICKYFKLTNKEIKYINDY